MELLNDFSPGLFIMQAVILIILIVLAGKFAWKPILASLDAREKGIEDALAAAENAKKEMAQLQASNEAAAQEARAQRESLIKEAREMKEKIVAEATEQAQAKADQIIAQAQETIQGEKRAALAEIKSQVASLSLEIAEKVVKEQLKDDQNQMQLIDKLIADAKI